MPNDDKPYQGARGPRKTKPQKAKSNVIKVPQFTGPVPDEDEGAKAAVDDAKPKRASDARRKPGPRTRITIRPSERQAEIWDPNFDLSQLDDEELVRGRRRGHDGTFKGGESKALPAAFHRRAMQELFKRADDNLRINLVACVDGLTKIATDVNIDPAVRARTAQWVIERVMGKTPDVVQLKAQDPWDAALDGVIAEAEESQIRKAYETLNKEEAANVGDE